MPVSAGAFDVGAHPERATASPALCIKATESAAFHVGRPVDDPPSLGHVQAASRALMPRTPRRYAVHLHLAGGQSERVFFPRLELFQEWYQGLANAAGQGGFVNVPISDLDGEYLVVRPEAVIAVRVEPQYSSADDA